VHAPDTEFLLQLEGMSTLKWPEWFAEDPTEANIVGQSFSLKVKKILHQGRSKYQDILVFERSARSSNILNQWLFAWNQITSNVLLECLSWGKRICGQLEILFLVFKRFSFEQFW